MLKLFGAVLVLLVGTASALGTVRYEKKRITVLDAWIDLILYIQAEIDCYLTPLQDMLRISNSPLMHVLQEGEKTDLGAILRSTSIYLDGNTKRLLESFVRKIGDGYREEQLKHCEYYLSSLRRERERMSGELPMRIRLYSAVCICTSLGTAILLW